MIVDKKGNLFEDRRKRKNDRRKNEDIVVPEKLERRKGERRKESNKIR